MDVDELMKLERPFTDEEQEFMEQQVLGLAKQLQSEIEKITKDLDPADPVVARLRAAPAKARQSIEKAIDVRADVLAAEDASIARQKAAAVYTWERLPAYEWNNRFAQVIGRLLTVLPKRLFIHAHLLAGQAALISNCIALGHRDTAPGEVVPKEELRAYRFIGLHGVEVAIEQLDELAKQTALGRSDVERGRDLLGKILRQFEWDLAEIDGEMPVMH